MKVSLIIPFRNEEAYASLTLGEAHAFLTRERVDFELIAVDDSTDNTWQIISTFQEKHDNVLITKGGNPAGYGTALRRGFELATGEIIIPFNGDFSDSLEDVMAYIHLIEGGYDMVFGSRFLPGASISGGPTLKTALSKWGNRFIQLLFGIRCNDITNSFKAYRREVWETISPRRIDTTLVIELALTSILRKFKYTTIPVSWSGRAYGLSKMSVLRVIPRYLRLIFEIRLGRL